MKLYKIKNKIHKYKSRPHFWIKPVYSDHLIQGIDFPDGLTIPITAKRGLTISHCRIGDMNGSNSGGVFGGS